MRSSYDTTCMPKWKNQPCHFTRVPTSYCRRYRRKTALVCILPAEKQDKDQQSKHYGMHTEVHRFIPKTPFPLAPLTPRAFANASFLIRKALLQHSLSWVVVIGIPASSTIDTSVWRFFAFPFLENGTLVKRGTPHPSVAGHLHFLHCLKVRPCFLNDCLLHGAYTLMGTNDSLLQRLYVNATKHERTK